MATAFDDLIDPVGDVNQNDFTDLITPVEQPSQAAEGFFGQIGQKLATGTRQALTGVKTATSAGAGFNETAGRGLAEMNAISQQRQRELSPQDIALQEQMRQNAAEFNAAPGIIAKAGEFVDYAGIIARNPRGTINMAAESIPNALVSIPVALAGKAAATYLGAQAGIAGGPTAIVTGMAGMAAGDVGANILLEGGGALHSKIREATGGASDNFTAEQFTQFLNENPGVIADAAKSAAIRGTVIGGLNTLTAGAAGRIINPTLMTTPARALARTGAATGVEVVGEGVGEGLAGLADTGKIDSEAIVQEMAGGLVTGAPEAFVGRTLFPKEQQEAKPPPLPETITSLQEEIKPEDIAQFDEQPAAEPPTEPALQPVPPVSVESGMFEAPQMEGQEYDLTPAPEAPISQPPTIKDSLSVQASVLPEQQAAQAPQAAVEGAPVAEESPVTELVEQPIPSKATETLRSITATLPPAKWTPEVFSKAERFYQTRDAADIEDLTPIQRKYINEALYQADPQAAEIQDAIDREAERKIRLQASSEKNMAKRDALKAEQAETWADSYINDARSRVSTGLDPVLLSAYVIKGAGIAKNYAQFTMKMVAKYGNAVKRYLRQAWQAITTREMPKLGGGRVRVRRPEEGAINVYHGTPHKVERFSSEKIGTGEGAQAYGYGLYFAQSKGIAAQYREQLSGYGDFTIGGKPEQVPAWSPDLTPRELVIRTIADRRAKMGDWMSDTDLLDSVESKIKDEASSKFGSEKWKLALAEFAAIKLEGVKTTKGGNLYAVEIQADEADFLDWDKPLSEQGERGQALLDTFNLRDFRSTGGFYDESDPEEATGKDAYFAAMESEGNGLNASALFLEDFGIKGIRYLDGMSRDDGEGTSNYVVFDDNAIEITAENDIPVTKKSQSWADSVIQESQQQVAMGINPKLMVAYTIKGTDLLKKGWDKFAPWSAEMVRRFGDQVSGYLRKVWQQLTTRSMPKLGGGRVRVRTNEGGFVAGYGGQALPNPTPATPPPLPPEAQGPEFAPGSSTRQSQSAYGPTPQRQDEGVGEYEARANAFFLQAANDYLATHTLEEATALVESNVPPAGMSPDNMPAIGERLIKKLNDMIATGTDLEKVQANALIERAETAWTGKASQDVGRAQQQRSAAKQRMDAYAEVMAARGLLVKRAKEKIEPRFEGGTTSAVTKLQDIADQSADDAGTNLTDILEGDDTPKKPKVKAVRDATEKLTKAQRTAESILNRLADTHQDPYGWKAKGESDPVRAFYNAHLQTPKTQAEFISGMVALGVPEGVASTIYTAATMEIAARDEIARVLAEELAEKKRLKQEQDKTKAEDRRIEIAENRASQLIYKTEERFRQGSKDLTTAKGGDSINKVFRDEVKEPMAEEKFFSRLLALGVRRDVAERLRLTAGRERADQQAMEDLKDAEAARSKVMIAENKASRLIYRTEEKLRQGSKDLGKSATGDSINKVFRDHVEAPMTWEAFRDRLTALNVGEAVAQRLMRTAERERTDQQAMEAFKEDQKARKLVSDILAKRSPKLAQMLRDLKDKIAPGMTWRDIFSELPAVQKDRQKEIYRRLLLDERLKGLDKTQRLALAIELDRAWQKERQKVFMAELDREGVLGQKDKEDTKKIKQAAPRLLRLMNVGLMNSELFREAIAKEYGIKTISAQEAAILRKMGEEIQTAPEGIPREQKQEKFMRRLQDLTGATKMEILESWWTASVLSGWRTQTDIALSISNGIEDVLAGSIVTAIRTKRFDIPRKAIGAMLGNLPTAFREASYYLQTGDRSIIPSFDMQRKASLEDGTKLIGNAGRYLREQGGIKGGFGTFMEFVERVMTALDHINSSSTYEGAKMMSLARNPELWKKYTNVTKGDLDIIRQRARDELTNGKPASTKAERVAEDAQVKFLIDQMFDVDLINQAREIGREAALQGDPQGIVGKALETLTAITSKPRQVLESMEKETTDANNNRSRKLVMFALRRVAPLTKVLTGTKFVRTVGQSINRNVSYIPGLGWVIRSGEASMSGAKQDILVAKQFIGFVVGMTLLAALRDQDDEEENLTIEGSWNGMNASKRGQRLAEGFQPNTISWRDSNGRRVSVNYMQWGLAGIFATLGAMEDQRKYFAGEKAELDILVSSLAAGLLAWQDKAQLQGIQSIFSESPYSSSDVGGNMLKRLNKYASNTVGGMVPRIAKDIDAVLSPELRDSSEWWMKWAAQVPMLRELSSGKRMNIFAEDIKLDRTPFSRVVQFGTTDPAYRTLGMLNERDIWLSDPSSGIRKVKMPGGTQREMTKTEKDRYQLEVGKAYKQFIIEQGERLLSMEKEKAQEVVERRTRMIRDMAARKATMK